jgi:hypothetical protein
MKSILWLNTVLGLEDTSVSKSSFTLGSFILGGFLGNCLAKQEKKKKKQHKYAQNSLQNHQKEDT